MNFFCLPPPTLVFPKLSTQLGQHTRIQNTVDPRLMQLNRSPHLYIWRLRIFIYVPFILPRFIQAPTILLTKCVGTKYLCSTIKDLNLYKIFAPEQILQCQGDTLVEIKSFKNNTSWALFRFRAFRRHCS